MSKPKLSDEMRGARFRSDAIFPLVVYEEWAGKAAALEAELEAMMQWFAQDTGLTIQVVKEFFERWLVQQEQEREDE